MMANTRRAWRRHHPCSADKQFGICGGKLHSHRRPHLIPAKALQIVVEVAKGGGQHQWLDTGLDRPFGERVSSLMSGGVVVAGDIKSASLRCEMKGGEVTCREPGDHGHRRHDLAQRHYRLNAFPGYHDRFGSPEPYAVAQQIAHRAARCGDGCFAAAVRIKPSTVNAGKCAVIIADGCDERWKGIRRVGLVFSVWSIPTVRMEP